MADVFKKQVVRWIGLDGGRCKPGTPGAAQHTELSRKWYGTVGGKPVPLCVDKQKSQQLLRKLLGDAELKRHGLCDPFEQCRRRPLADHLAAFGAALRAKGDSKRHVSLTMSRIQAVVDGIQAVWLADLDAARAGDYLTALRADQQPVKLPEGQDSFRLAEIAVLLGVKPGSISKAVQRHRLKATGAGKARRLPRETVQVLASRLARGVSPETVNHHVRALRSFGRWLVRSRRWGANPFETLSLLNTATDRRHDRRELEADELRRLLAVTLASGRTFRGLAGPDRWALYLTACGTGFRVRALAGLTPGDFDLSASVPALVLPARLAKNKKAKVQPLPSDVTVTLRGYLADKPTGQPVWPGSWRDAAAEMIRGDLGDAGIPYIVPGPDGDLFADFHALRHSYLTLLGRGGVDLRTAQELAGHSTPTLTARYSHRRLYDLAGAVEKLPSLLPTGGKESEAARLRATGTDGASGCSVLARTAGSQRHQQVTTGIVKGVNNEGAAFPQPLAASSNGTSSHRQSSVKAVGLEPTTNGLKVRCSAS
jgi:integrase/recombinase XerC